MCLEKESFTIVKSAEEAGKNGLLLPASFRHLKRHLGDIIKSFLISFKSLVNG